ncbi:MAG: methionyl-tRNA formyltransferase [Flavobacteriaceae bacterium]|nr:methionyl-tRNA formyltransferase [Flavobacteriaceae bacterium]
MKPKIIFFGTPDFAVQILEVIYNANMIIDAVVTSPDKKSGRGRKITSSAVKKFCLVNKIKYHQPDNLKENTFLSTLKSYNSDIYVVVAFRMIPKLVWSIPKIATFNLHASLLPEYRGAAPINWVLINQEKYTGLTTFMIDNKIDTGKILLQSQYKIKKGEIFDSLQKELIKKGKKLVINTIELLLKKNYEAYEQKFFPKLNSAPKLTKNNTKIDWRKSLRQINALIDGLNSYPGAWSYISGESKTDTFKIYEAECEYKSHKFNHNKLLFDKRSIKIAHREGFLVIKNLKLPNKRRMTSKELLNGYVFKSDVFVS